MNLTRVKYLYQKELREILRNWGLIILLVFFPLIVYPTSLIFMAEFGASQQKKLQKEKTHLAVAGSLYAPELTTLLKDNSELEPVFDDALTKDSVPNKNKAVIIIPSSFKEVSEAGTTVDLDIYYDSTVRIDSI